MAPAPALKISPPADGKKIDAGEWAKGASLTKGAILS